MSVLTKLYSKLAKEIEKAPIKKATPEEWTNYLRNRGVKQEELQNWQKALENMPADFKMSPQDAAEQFRVLGDVPIRESKLTANPNYDLMQEYHQTQYPNLTGNEMQKLVSPKYGSEYSLAGAPEHAYEELVLHSPWAEKLAKDPSHYTDVPGGDQNIAWLRYNMRQLMNDQLPDKAALIPNSPEFVPAKLFHLDELQSNRHQAGQKKGYRSYKATESLMSELENLSNSIDQESDRVGALLSDPKNELSAKEAMQNLKDMEARRELLRTEQSRIKEASPDAPFKGDNWKNLGLRRALLEAAQNDADLFSWTPGSMQQQRWQGIDNEGTSRMYDKYIPGQLMKDLKDHGVTPEHFLQIPDPSKSYDTRELPQSLAALVSSTDDPPFLGHIAEFLQDFESNPSMMRRNLYSLGMHPDRISSAMDELGNFSIARHSFIDDPEIDMEKVMDFGSEFVPQYLREGLSLNTQQLPAVRLTPEIRKSILEKGFPKYMLPLGAAGISMEQEPVQGYASGGSVKKLIDSFRKAKLDSRGNQHIETFGFGDINTDEEEFLKRLVHGDEYSVNPDAMNVSGVENSYTDFLKGQTGDELFNIHNHHDDVAPSLKDLQLLSYLSTQHPKIIDSDVFITSSYPGQYKLSQTKQLKKPSTMGDFIEQAKLLDDRTLNKIIEQTTMQNDGIIDQYLRHTISDPDLANVYSYNIKSSQDFPALLVGKHLKNKGLYSIEYPEYKIIRDSDKELLDDMRDEIFPKLKFASGGKVAKQGAAVLRELLENLHKTDPERMRRAEEAGFDTDQIWLRGDAGKHEPKDFNFFTQDPSIADLYSTSYHRNSFDNTPSHLPVFVKKGVNAYDFDNHMYQRAPELASRTISKVSPQESYILKNIIDDDVAPGADVFSDLDIDDIVEQTLQDQYVAKLNDAKSIFNNFMPEDLESNKFAKGGKVGPAAAYDESSESLETALRSLMDAYTLAQSDEMMGGLGAAYAKMMRPELFDDIDYSTLADAAAANSEVERHRLEEEHPVASALGMLASVPAYASFGGASLAGQMGANALLGGAYRYGDHEDPLDPTSVGIDLALPAAFRNLKRTAQGLALAIPAVGLSGDSDLELSSLRDLVHNVPDNYRIRP